MRDTLGTDMSMPGGAQAGRSIGVSKPRRAVVGRVPSGGGTVVGLLSEPNVLIISQQGEQKRKLAVRSWSHTKGTCGPRHLRRRGRQIPFEISAANTLKRSAAGSNIYAPQSTRSGEPVPRLACAGARGPMLPG
ncbi:hypothetical protein Slala02_05000 [Streptomyces lavendulae subsp. lavendulae]|nr:hypothetical protein Slala02_05000 [Streptomyces lavendulae subsp. lavendulae]